MIILLYILFGAVDGCVRTADTGATTVAPGVTTTVVATTTVTATEATTTTTVATTTTTTSACNSCMASQLVLGPDPDDGDLGHSPDPPTAGTQDGCATLTITCTPLAGQAQSLMTFQNGLGGPPPGNPATATLVCNNMGQYQLEDFNGPSVTEVHCFG